MLFVYYCDIRADCYVLGKPNSQQLDMEALPRSIANPYLGSVSYLPCSLLQPWQLLLVFAFILTHRSCRQFIILSSVELTSILVVVLSHRLRIMAVLSSGYRATVESLPNVHSSSTTHNSTSRDGNCMCRVSKVQSNFHFRTV